jgi:myo-inositol-1(or 4)-monophosphatase
MPSEQDVQSRLDLAVAAAREASTLILSHYRTAELGVEFKGDATPVTVADRGAEELLRGQIEAAFPDDGILGEEFDDKPSNNGYRWVLDPIDGTKPFIHGVPLFGTLIGIEYDDRVVVGVCRFPALDEVVYAAEGGGTWWQIGDDEPRRTHVSKVDKLSDALFCFTEVDGWDEVGRAAEFERLVGAVRVARGWGDCFGHVMVALGRAEIAIDPQMSPWDVAALIPIVQEAGGSCASFDHSTSIHAGSAISVNPHLTDAVYELVGSRE